MLLDKCLTRRFCAWWRFGFLEPRPSPGDGEVMLSWSRRQSPLANCHLSDSFRCIVLDSLLAMLLGRSVCAIAVHPCSRTTLRRRGIRCEAPPCCCFFHNELRSCVESCSSWNPRSKKARLFTAIWLWVGLPSLGHQAAEAGVAARTPNSGPTHPASPNNPTSCGSTVNCT